MLCYCGQNSSCWLSTIGTYDISLDNSFSWLQTHKWTWFYVHNMQYLLLELQIGLVTLVLCKYIVPWMLIIVLSHINTFIFIIIINSSNILKMCWNGLSFDFAHFHTAQQVRALGRNHPLLQWPPETTGDRKTERSQLLNGRCKLLCSNYLQTPPTSISISLIYLKSIQTQENLTNDIMRWISTNSQPISIVDVRVRNIFWTVTNDKYEPPWMQELNEKEKTTKQWHYSGNHFFLLLETPLCHYNYLGVTVHYTEELWVLHSHAEHEQLFLLHSRMIQIKVSDGGLRWCSCLAILAATIPCERLFSLLFILYRRK